jgi:hypothetical protein
MRSSKLSDGSDPIELEARLRGMLEASFRYVHQHTSTWLNPAGVKATIGYGGGSYRLSLYEPGRAVLRPTTVVDMHRLDHIRRAEKALTNWARAYPTPIGDTARLVAQITR